MVKILRCSLKINQDFLTAPVIVRYTEDLARNPNFRQYII